MKYKIGDSVKMSPEAIETYGQQWEDVKLIITHAANKYMPAATFFSQGQPAGYSPGYDTGVRGQGLYDLKRADDGTELNMSLYDWELE